MPLFITLTHGQTIIVKGESIRWHELRRKIVRAVSLSGHVMAIRKEAIIHIEHVPEEHYQKMIEEMKRKKEGEAAGQQGRIARPAMVIPRKGN